MTEILLIRHGETLWNQQGRMQGQNDSPLTPTGLEQARKLARRLKDVAFTALYSSDLGRAHQTARCIADATGHEIIADRGLRERSFGIFEGLTNAEIQVRHPEDYALFAKRDAGLRDAGRGERGAVPRARRADARSDRGTASRRDDRRREPRPRARRALSHRLRDGARSAARLPAAQLQREHVPPRPEGWLAVAMCDVGHLAEDEVTRFSDAAVSCGRGKSPAGA